METTTAFYAGAETRSAGQHFAAVIDGLRSAAPKRPAAKGAPIGARKSKLKESAV